MAISTFAMCGLLLVSFQLTLARCATLKNDVPATQEDDQDDNLAEGSDYSDIDDYDQDFENVTAVLVDAFQDLRRSQQFRNGGKYARKRLHSKVFNDLDGLLDSRDTKQRVKRSTKSRTRHLFGRFCLKHVCPYSCRSFGGQSQMKLCWVCKHKVCNRCGSQGIFRRGCK